MSAKPLSDQQLLFCVKYIENGGNGSQAAIDAKYAKAGSRVRAHKLLKDPRVQAKIAELTARAATEATAQIEQAGVQKIAEQAITDEAEKSSIELAVQSLQERIQRRLMSMGLTELPEIAKWDADTVSFVPSTELAAEARGSVQSVKAQINEVITEEGDKIFRKTTMEVKQHNPMPALRELMKLTRMIPRDDKPGTKTVVGVQVIVSGGATGIEAVEVQGKLESREELRPTETQREKEYLAPAPVAPAPRPWRPGPRKQGKTLASVAALARAAMAAP